MTHLFRISVVVISLLACVATHSASASDVVYTPTDQTIFSKYMTYITPYKNKEDEIVLQKTAEFFINTPYVAGTLDNQNEEKLVINLREMDCVTFVENVLALSQTAKMTDRSFDNFIESLRTIRYRNGKIDGYSSRLHYTSDWVYANEQRGVVKNISKELGGLKEMKRINFMSQHPNSYKAIKNDKRMLSKIKEIEANINKRGGFYYVPKLSIERNKKRIPHMSVVAFVTNTRGLDTSHVGLAYKDNNNRLTFIHASSAKGKVVIDNLSLHDYCQKQYSCTGIMVVASYDL